MFSEPNGGPIDAAWFEWGPTLDMPYSVPTPPTSYGGTGATFITHDEIIGPLASRTRYYFRYFARNSIGESSSEVQTFMHGDSTVYGFNSQVHSLAIRLILPLAATAIKRLTLQSRGRECPWSLNEHTIRKTTNQGRWIGWNHSFNISLATPDAEA